MHTGLTFLRDCSINYSNWAWWGGGGSHLWSKASARYCVMRDWNNSAQEEVLQDIITDTWFSILYGNVHACERLFSSYFICPFAKTRYKHRANCPLVQMAQKHSDKEMVVSKQGHRNTRDDSTQMLCTLMKNNKSDHIHLHMTRETAGTSLVLCMVS